MHLFPGKGQTGYGRVYTYHCFPKRAVANHAGYAQGVNSQEPTGRGPYRAVFQKSIYSIEEISSLLLNMWKLGVPNTEGVGLY